MKCLELSKTPLPAPPSKSKEKERSKGKAKPKDPKVAPEPAFDYHDGAASDAALRAHLLRAHQTFLVSMILARTCCACGRTAHAALLYALDAQ